MDLELEGRTALVTGGGRDLGKAIAPAVACEVANLALPARDPITLSDASAGSSAPSGRKVADGMRAAGSGRIVNIGGLARSQIGNTVGGRAPRDICRER